MAPGTCLFSSFTRGADILDGVYNASGISINARTVISGNAPDNRYGC